ncbi:MAG: metallophosphoesterase [Thaumarchaeota archaeon]|nr:metallophosphoesterase [Nitrososphaerota archaeon]
MAKSSVVSISDIHIGDNSIACWYNKDFHEPYLKAILEYVKSQKDNLNEFIILGDLFDFWTYPPDVRPPSAADIINANPNIFGKGGALDAVVTALGGNVSYVVGNHDISVTQADLDMIPLSEGYKITKRPDKYVTRNCLFTHGHLFTIFNAPDPDNPVPLGHFVTRLISYYVQQQGTPAWKVTGFGAPAERKILSSPAFLPALKFLNDMFVMQRFDASTVANFVDIWVQVTKFPTDGTFEMADGSTKTVADVKRDYAGLFARWVNDRGIEYVQKSVYTDGVARSMSWFTQQEALKTNAALTITGHTHWPTSGTEALADDLNCGFECFAEPDSQSSRYTFAQINFQDGLPPGHVIYQVTADSRGNHVCNPAVGIPTGDIVFGPVAKDFSAYIRVYNDSGKTLTRSSFANDHGKWVLEPDKTIASGGFSGFWLQDLPGLFGASGSVEYTDGTDSFVLHFDCPLVANNVVSIGGAGARKVSYQSKVSNGPWMGNSVNPRGHPLSIVFNVK